MIASPKVSAIMTYASTGALGARGVDRGCTVHHGYGFNLLSREVAAGLICVRKLRSFVIWRLWEIRYSFRRCTGTAPRAGRNPHHAILAMFRMRVLG